jgi:hypothetical protein
MRGRREGGGRRVVSGLRVGRETRRLGVIRCSLSEGGEVVTAFWAGFCQWCFGGCYCLVGYPAVWHVAIVCGEDFSILMREGFEYFDAGGILVFDAGWFAEFNINFLNSIMTAVNGATATRLQRVLNISS